jgi:hypothetical protein
MFRFIIPDVIRRQRADIERRIAAMGQKLDQKLNQKFERMIPFVVMVCVVMVCATIFPVAQASAQAVTLQEQLVAQYKPAKMGSDTSGYSVTEEGTLLAIQKGGLIGVPYSDSSVQNNKYEGGTVKPPNALLSKGIGFGMKKFGKEQTTKLFAKGDKVYPTKVDVNLEKDTVTLGIVACDKCNKTDPTTYNKANVVFVFPKGSLANASAGDVENTIGQLLAISDDSQQQDQGQQQGQDQQGGQQQGQDQQAAQPAAAAPAAQADPVSIEVGMTPDQVTTAMGKPDKIVKLTSKQIYYYKDMKVTFVNGKVSDVQ